MIYADPVHVELYSFQDTIPRRNFFQLMAFLGNVCQKVCEVAQENVGINSLKVLTFISHDSLDQLPVDVAVRMG